MVSTDSFADDEDGVNVNDVGLHEKVREDVSHGENGDKMMTTSVVDLFHH